MEPEAKDEPASVRFGVDEGGIIIEVRPLSSNAGLRSDGGGRASEPLSSGEEAVTPESLIESPDRIKRLKMFDSMARPSLSSG